MCFVPGYSKRQFSCYVEMMVLHLFRDVVVFEQKSWATFIFMYIYIDRADELLQICFFQHCNIKIICVLLGYLQICRSHGSFW